ncbi:hypothetical protein KC363_g3056 [Hortaea werneckii]|uniref:Inner membrane assembly complex subunit 17 n=1 Tax=Hortaea werneckii TaxID=91943 RepID=A0A3M7G1M5_HORWE|nr:hypothetical protein KC361_g4215 [Hortaea werneckii]KAI7192903.1 hypothetical protein KC363_g3056 [Hortaea werneckii]RMY95039.1 hypothetical protein D0861_01015 [Hortaea werneckii]
MLSLRRLALQRARSISFQPIRRESTQRYEPPSQTQSQQKSNATRDFYRTFSRPLIKNFLIAVAVYQVLYYGWAKLESLDVKREKEGEMRSLQGEIDRLTAKDPESRK